MFFILRNLNEMISFNQKKETSQKTPQIYKQTDTGHCSLRIK